MAETKKIMKTITVQLIKNIIFPEKDIYNLKHYFHTLEEHAPSDIYDYFKLGGTNIFMKLNPTVMTNDLPLLLKDFYKAYPDPQSIQQRENVLHEFSKYGEITWELCEELGYKHSEEFYPAFMNDAFPKPYLMYEDGLKAECTGIVLHIIPPEAATFDMLHTLEDSLHSRLSSHPLAKALKVCIR